MNKFWDGVKSIGLLIASGMAFVLFFLLRSEKVKSQRQRIQNKRQVIRTRKKDIEKEVEGKSDEEIADELGAVIDSIDTASTDKSP